MISNVKPASFFVATLIFLLVQIVSVPSLQAGGIRFWEMPIGCRWINKYSNGNEWERTYIGKRNGKYRVVTRNKTGARERISTTDYNDQGFMTRRVWAGNKWETFEPHSCFHVIGQCTNTYRNADGVVLNITSKTTAIGDSRFRVEASSPESGRFPVDTFTKTHFGLQLYSENKNRSVRMTELRNCNVPTS